jgi:hypothetical protein
MCSQIIKQVKTNTFSQIYIQVVFAVKGRSSLVSKSWEEELYKYVSGFITNKGQKLLAINGMRQRHNGSIKHFCRQRHNFSIKHFLPKASKISPHINMPASAKLR